MIYAVNKRTKEHRLIGERPCLGHYPGVDEFWVVADPDGWIEWLGGECPLPCGQPCEAKTRNGERQKFKAAGRVIGWKKAIIAYRPILDEHRQATMAGAKPPAWNGEGLPPVGCECEAEDDYGQWQRCRIVGVEGAQIWVDFADDGYVTRHINDIDLRPLRSEEDLAVDEMVDTIMQHHGCDGVDTDDLSLHLQAMDHARALYRAGYRKVSND